MKNFIYFGACLFVMAFNLVSCQSENFQIDTDVVSDGLEKSSIHVIYDGNDYYSQVSYCEDSLLIEDSTLASLMDNLYANSADVQTILHADGTIEYFDNKEAYRSKYPFEEIKGEAKKDDVITKSSSYYDQFDGYALLWTDENYNGVMTDAVNIFKRVPQIDNLTRDCDDKISSIEVYFNMSIILGRTVSSKLECFEYSDRTGSCLTIKSSSRSLPSRTANLKTVPYGKNGNWNDRISSIRFSVVEESILVIP